MELSTMAFQSLPLNTAAKNMFLAKIGTLVKIEEEAQMGLLGPLPDLTQSCPPKSASVTQPPWSSASPVSRLQRIKNGRVPTQQHGPELQPTPLWAI